VPGEVLTPAEPGLFGKLPATGDFVSRGLSHAFTRAWDGWVTRHVVTRLRAGAALPDSGLRFRLVSGGRVAAGVVLASSDAAGRSYPLSLVLVAPGLPDASALDPWCDAASSAAAPARSGLADADMLWQALAALDPPGGDTSDGPALWLWARGSAGATRELGPETALSRIMPLSSY